MHDTIIQRMSALAADMREAKDQYLACDHEADQLLDIVEEFLASLSENATPPGPDSYATPMRVRADQVMIGDVVVFEPTPHSTDDPYLGTVWKVEATHEDVAIHFHGPQMEERAVDIGRRRQVSIVRMVERP